MRCCSGVMVGGGVGSGGSGGTSWFGLRLRHLLRRRGLPDRGRRRSGPDAEVGRRRLWRSQRHLLVVLRHHRGLLRHQRRRDASARVAASRSRHAVIAHHPLRRGGGRCSRRHVVDRQIARRGIAGAGQHVGGGPGALLMRQRHLAGGWFAAQPRRQRLHIVVGEAIGGQRRSVRVKPRVPRYAVLRPGAAGELKRPGGAGRRHFARAPGFLAGKLAEIAAALRIFDVAFQRALQIGRGGLVAVARVGGVDLVVVAGLDHCAWPGCNRRCAAGWCGGGGSACCRND